LDLFDELQVLDHNPDAVTYNALLSSFRKRPDMYKVRSFIWIPLGFGYWFWDLDSVMRF
jgi:hypothetical protein